MPYTAPNPDLDSAPTFEITNSLSCMEMTQNQTYTKTEPLCLRNMLVQACQNHGSIAGHPSCLVLTPLLGNIIMERFPFRCLFDDPCSNRPVTRMLPLLSFEGVTL